MNRTPFPDGYVRLSEAGCGAIDQLQFLDTLIRNVDPRGTGRIPAGCNILVRGWAYNPAPARVARGVLARIDDALTIDCAYGRSRPDIALSFGVPELEASGFQAVYPLSELAIGRHRLTIVTLDEDAGYYQISRDETFEIVSSRELFPGVAKAASNRMKISMDGFTALGSGAIPTGGALSIERGDIVYVRGWAIDLEHSTSLRGVFAIVDDDEYVMGVHGLPRQDVARTVRLPDVVRCGFTLRVPTRSLAPGSHSLRVAALAADDTYGVSPIGTIHIA